MEYLKTIWATKTGKIVILFVVVVAVAKALQVAGVI